MKNKNEYIDEACEQILKISADEEKRLKYEARVKAARDYNTAMSASFDDGLQQGLKEGEFKNSIKVIRNMYNAGVDIELMTIATKMDKENVEKICTICDEVHEDTSIDEIYNMYINEISPI